MKNILFIGQAPARPQSKHEIAGTYLRPWLHRIGLSDSYLATCCHFDALIGEYPGSSQSGHLIPLPDQIIAYRPLLVIKIRALQPDIIVPVGKLAIASLVNQPLSSLIDVIGKTFTINPYDTLPRPVLCIPLPHPSGRSVWNVQHPELVNLSLLLLKDAIEQEN